MKAQYRSPTRKPVQSISNLDGSAIEHPQAQRVHETRPLESQLSNFNLEDEAQEPIGASAERSPGRISGRNRDTAMFDPRRGTYLPYGGFDSVIDEYYTEGDPSTLAIPAPSTMQRREQSRSPERSVPKSSSNNSIAHSANHEYGNPSRQNGGLRPEMTHHMSNNGVASSNADHNSSGRFRAMHDNRSDATAGSSKSNQYYDQDASYEHNRNQSRPVHHEQDYAPPKMPIAHAPYERRGSNDRRGPMPPLGSQQQPQHQQRPRGYDDGHSAQSRMRQGPPLRAQRSMDFPQQVRQGHQQGYGGPQMEPRRRLDQNVRDPRAMQQDPRLAPRPGSSNDPRLRAGPGSGRQPMRAQEDPYMVDDGRAQRGPQLPVNEDVSYDNRQARRPLRNGPPPSRNGMPSGTSPYPQSSRSFTDEQSPMEGARSPPDSRMTTDSRGFQQASAPARDARGLPAIAQPQPSVPQPQPQPRSQAPRADQSRPDQTRMTNQSQRLPQQAPIQRPEPTLTKPQVRPEDASDMIMQSESVGVVTLSELSHLRKEAAKGSNPVAQLTLVKRLMDAARVLADEGGKADAKQTKKNRDDYSREALRILKQITSQEKPYPEAVFFLANCYGNGALALDVDHERAFALYESAAKMQHPASAYRTAVCLEIGAGARQDVDRAVRFYERAAEYGDASAMYKVGMIFLRGLLAQKPDPRLAVTWLQKAAEKADIENPHALHELGLLYEKGDAAAGIAQNENFAKELFTKAAKLHYAPSQFRMGYAYEYGTLGCPVDPRRSIAWFSRGAERGDPESELSLSGWYLTGSEGVLAQNDREAYLWGRKAAEKGLAKAEFAVGYFFESGIGTPMDIDEAIKWYKRAATAGQKKAQERLLALGKRRK